MNRNIIGKLFLCFVIVFVAMSFVSAQIDIQKYTLSYDFFSGAEVASPNVCSCSSFIDKISVVNTGSFGAVFTIDTNIPELARVPFGEVMLEPGENANVDIIIDAACGLQDELDYDVTIRNNFDREQIISRSLLIQKCQSLEASLFVEKDSILPCEPLTYQVKLDNPSTFRETYNVEPLNFADSFDSERYEVVVEPGQTGVVDMELGLSCDVYGPQTVAFRVTSLNNELEAELTHELEVEQDYEFSAGIPEELSTCEDSATEFEISLTNDVRFGNSYALSIVNGPDFVSLEEESIVVAGEDVGTFKIIASPGKDDLGTYDFAVKIVSDFGDQELEKNVTLRINECFKLFVEIEGEDNPELCADVHEFDAVVRNDGFLDEKIFLELSTDGLLSDYVFDLEPGEQKNVTISVNLPGKLDGEKLPITLTASLNERDTTKTWSDTIEPRINSQYACSYTTPLKTKLYVSYSGEETFMGIRNRGVIESTYDLTFVGNDKISFEPDSLTIPPGEMRFIKINVNYTDEDLRNNFYSITLTAQNGVAYEYNFRIIRTNGAFIENTLDYFKVSNCKIITLVLLLLVLAAFILLIVRLSIKGSSWKDLWNYRLILILIGVLAILAVFVLYGFPESTVTPLDETDPLTIQWYEDEIKTLDLNKYFADPDADVLTYEVEGDEPKNVDVEIESNLATFTPEADWSGNKRIRFTATDEDGESVTSPRITLEVVEVTDMSFAELHSIYCVYFNLALIILLLLFLLAIPWKNRTKESGKVKLAGVQKEKGYHYYVDADGDVSRRVTKRKK